MTVTIPIEAELFELARNAAGRRDRTEAQQIADWARLGSRLEATLQPESVEKLLRPKAVDLRKAIDFASSPEGQERMRAHLAQLGVPLYGSDPDVEGGLIQHLPDGRRIPGRMEGRQFIPTSSESAT